MTTAFDAALAAVSVCTCDIDEEFDLLVDIDRLDPDCPRHGTLEVRIHAVLEAAAPEVRRLALQEAAEAVKGVDAIDSALMGTDAALYAIHALYKDVE